MLNRSSSSSDDSQGRYENTPFRYKRERQKLVVRMKKGEAVYGTCFALNRKAPGFHLDMQGKLGESLDRTSHITFDDVKAVFLVKSFDGRFNPDDYRDQEMPQTRALAVKFMDGEVLIGRPANPHWETEPRFYIVPEDRESNNLMVLVERSAVKSVHDAKAHFRKQQEEYEAYKSEHARPGMSEEECKGDYCFSRHEYKDALRYYREVRDRETENERINHKLCATKYNLGVRHIKQRDYVRALRYMEMVLKINPAHPQALEKAEQLRRHITKHG